MVDEELIKDRLFDIIMRKPGRPTTFDMDGRKKFLELYATFGVMAKAAKEAGVSPSTVSTLKNTDPNFAQACADAKLLYKGELEYAAYQRGVEGVDEPVYYQGQLVDTQKKYSDKILELLLKAEMPDKFIERKELSGPGGQPLQINVVKFDELGDKAEPIDAEFKVPEPGVSDAKALTQGTQEEEDHQDQTSIQAPDNED